MAELNFDIERRLSEWLDRCCRNPFSLIPTFKSEGDDICYASVLVFPRIDAAKDPGRRDIFTLFGGELHDDRALKFRTALRSIGFIYGVDDREALVIMAQTIILVAGIAQLKHGLDPTLPAYVHNVELEPGKEDTYIQKVNRPLLQVENVLEVWLSTGAGINLREHWLTPAIHGLGRLFYYSFPPVWLPKERLDRLNSDRTNGFTLPLQVNSECFAAVESFSQLLEHTQQTGLPMELKVASPGQPAEEKVAPGVPRVNLTEEELTECDRYQFKGRLPIEITGQVVARKSNEVRIAGASVHLTDAEFVLFLRLVVALLETDDGYLDRSTLSGSHEENVYAPEFIDQALYRLRTKLTPVSQGLDARKYIEVHHKRIRLSTHRRYILANRSLLLEHQVELIRDLAGRLPEG